MPCDFTVIQAVRQRFGDSDPEGEIPQEQEAPFVGLAKDFPFNCPAVASSQVAVLQFESFAVDAGRLQVFIPNRPRNIIRINGVDLPGGLTPGLSRSISTNTHEGIWKSNTLLVPANVLRQQNVLHIEAVRIPLTSNQNNIDNFIIDNVVVFFKQGRQTAGGVVTGGVVLPATAAKKKAKRASKKKAARRSRR